MGKICKDFDIVENYEVGLMLVVLDSHGSENKSFLEKLSMRIQVN